jgi:hypothetical protein
VLQLCNYCFKYFPLTAIRFAARSSLLLFLGGPAQFVALSQHLFKRWRFGCFKHVSFWFNYPARYQPKQWHCRSVCPLRLQKVHRVIPSERLPKNIGKRFLYLLFPQTAGNEHVEFFSSFSGILVLPLGVEIPADPDSDLIMYTDSRDDQEATRVALG